MGGENGSSAYLATNESFKPTPLWQLRLSASAATTVDSVCILGISPAATDGFDSTFDIPKPPAPGGNYVQIYFPHPEYGLPTGNNFSQDFRAARPLADTVTRWTFEVTTNIVDTTVSLNFISDGAIPSGFGILLKDLTGGTRKNLKTNGLNFSYNSGAGGIRRFEILVGDSTAPAVSLIKPNGGEIIRSGKNYSIQWNESDRMGLDSTRILYSINAGTSYSPITTLFGAQSTYGWLVPYIYLNYQGCVALVATDSMGNTFKEVSNTVLTFAGDSLASPFVAGWNLMGTALRPNDSTVTGNFSDDISQAYYVFDYSPTTGYTRPTALTLGLGHWLGLLSNQTVDVIGQPAIDSVVTPLQQGFNIVSNSLVIQVPKTALYLIKGGTTLLYQSAIDSGWIASGLTGFNNNAQNYQLSDTLKIWNGYWLGVLKTGVSLLVKPPLRNTIPILPSVIRTTKTSSSTDWQVGIIAQFGTATDQPLTFGVKPDATPGFDATHDIPKAPIPPVHTYVETYFFQPSWTPVLGSKFVSSFTSPTAPLLWTFYVAPSDSGVVVLRWNSQDIQNSVPSNIGLTLQDNVSGTLVNLRTTASYSFAAQVPRPFSISGTVTSVGSRIGLPTSFALSQNYPNPFNPSTTVSFALPERSRVNLEVFNILGQRVVSLVDDQMEAGYHQSVWNANVASGMYFYRIEAVSVTDGKRFVDVKKMILLK